MSDAIRHPVPLRSVLFVPGDRPDRVVKAFASGVDAVAVDLEDAVAMDHKPEARELAVNAIRALPAQGPVVLVRVNAMDSAEISADVEALTRVIDRVDAVILAMASTPDDVRALASLLERAEAESGTLAGHTRILPLIETASGVMNSREIAAESRVLTLTFGPADLSRELGITPSASGDEMATARSLVVLAAAANTLQRPVDGPYLTLEDDEGLRLSVASARRLGFGGKQIIHPSQLNMVSGAFGPTPAELEWAQKVHNAFREAEARGVSSIRLDDGTFIDYPIARRARTLLEESGQ